MILSYKGIDWKENLPKAIELGQQGKSLQEIGEHFGVSRQRIKQVFQQFSIDPTAVGVKIQTKQRRERKAAAYFQKWGNREATELYDKQREKFRRKKANAKRIGWEWTIEFGDLTWPTHCPILGLELDYFAESTQENSPSFDQIISGLGYVKGNVHIISWRANRIKNNGTSEEHQLISNYLKNMLTVKL